MIYYPNQHANQGGRTGFKLNQEQSLLDFGEYWFLVTANAQR